MQHVRSYAWNFLLLFLALSAFFPQWAQPLQNPVLLNSAADGEIAYTFLKFNLNASPDAGLGEMQKAEQEFKNIYFPGAIPSFGMNMNVKWARLDVDNNTDDENWMLYVEYPRIKELEIYITDPAGRQSLQHRTGYQIPFNSRIVQSVNFIIPVHLPPHSAARVYFRMRSDTAISFPVKLMRPLAVFQREGTHQIFFGLILGALLIMLAFNLFLMVLSRDRNYAYFSLYILSSLFFFTTQQGLFFKFFSTVSGLTVTYLIQTAIPLYAISSGLFLRHYISLQIFSKNLNRIYFVFLVLSLCWLLAMSFVPPLRLFMGNVILISITFLVILGTLIFAVYRRIRLAIVLIMGYSLPVCSGLAYLFRVQGVLPANFFTMNGLFVADVFTSVIFSYVLVLKLRELRLEKSEAIAREEIKSRFLAVMSHEIRTPLNSVLGHASLLKTGKEAGGNDRHIDAIQSSGQHLLHLVNNILESARADSADLSFSSEPIDLEKIIGDIMAMFSFGAEEKNLATQVFYDGSLPRRFISDSGRIRQILLNVIGNAFKFTDRGTVAVNVTGTEIGESQWSVKISISDTGIGLDEHQMKHVMDPFAQADSAVWRKYGGSGLGLTISKKIIERLSGVLAIHSEIDHGCTVDITLPLPKAVDTLVEKQSESLSVSEPELPRDHKTIRLLLVDDNESNRLLMHAFLEGTNVDITDAVNGRFAVEAFREGVFDLILMDIQMPEMDGLEATRIIREIEKTSGPPGGGIPILALSGNAFAEDKMKSIEAGCNKHLVKPISLNDFYQEIRNFYPNFRVNLDH